MRYKNLNRFVIALAVMAVLTGVRLVIVAKSAADGGTSTTPAVTSTTATTTTESVTTEPDQTVLLQQCNRGVLKYRATTWHWQHLMGRSRTRSHYKASASNSLSYCQAVQNLWHGRAVRWQASAKRWMQKRILEYRSNDRIWRLVWGIPALGRTLAAGGSLEEQFRRLQATYQHDHRRWIHPPYLADWLCIHRYEGSWTDPGSPYWGGLQMDLTFQLTYGKWLLRHKGTADHWTPLEQIWVAVRAERTRGFSPWPNTARDCGLL